MNNELNHRQLLEKLRRAGELGFNVLMEGPAGTGKTSLVQQVAKELDLRLKYYSASTLDPFVDLVGLPTPVVHDDGRRSLEFHRQDDINNAELIFFDELNRAHAKVLNAVLELIQFHTINGELLPHLIAVFAACNPADGDYQVTDLDPALVGRFHMHLKFGLEPDRRWFIEKYGDTGRILCDWRAADLEADQALLVSPRKLEHMAMLIEKECDPADSMPLKDKKLPFHLLSERLNSPQAVTDAKDFANDPDKYISLVSEDAEMALRFVSVLKTMKATQLNAVRMIVLCLPGEMLASVNEDIALMTRLFKAVSSREGPSEGKAYRELIADQLGIPVSGSKK